MISPALPLRPAQFQPRGAVHLFAGLYVKEMLTPDAGTIIPQHSHSHPHLSYIAAGGVRCWRGDEYLGEFTAPTAIRIEAEQPHRFETTLPWTLVLCLHAVNAAEGGFAEVDLIHEQHQVLPIRET